jgi:hypothetical protein
MANIEEPPVVVVEETRLTPDPERRVVPTTIVDTKPQRREAITRGVSTLGSTGGALLGLAAIILSILALSGLLTVPLTAVAVITVGAALLFESASHAAHSSVQGGSRDVVFGGVGADAFTGLAAITLGVLALLGIRPMLFLPIAVLALGAGLLFSGASAVVERVHNVVARGGSNHPQDAVSGVGGVHLLVGGGALVLGILGILGGSPVLLTLIATLSVGAALMLSGAALGARPVTTVHHAS